MNTKKRIYLSPPHMCGDEINYVNEAFASNWIAPAGPDLSAFEQSVCAYTGAPYGVALSSGTAAIHLSLLVGGVQHNDDVFCSTFTFGGSVFPVSYVGANLVLIDSEKSSWNMDPEMLLKAIKDSRECGRHPKAVIAVHLYGQSADVLEINKICDNEGLLLIEDAAESLGAFCGDRHTGTIGDFGIFSFNGNKIITTSGGGMLVGKNEELIETARFLSTQARDPFPYYQHSHVGYNYRMSNVVAAIGRGQMSVIEKRVNKRRDIYAYYGNELSNVDGVTMIPNDVYGKGNCWLSCILIDLKKTGIKPEQIRLALEKENIESRPLWKPMHLQPVFKDCHAALNGASEQLFACGLCLPSGSNMSDNDLRRVVNAMKSVFSRKQ